MFETTGHRLSLGVVCVLVACSSHPDATTANAVDASPEAAARSPGATDGGASPPMADASGAPLPPGPDESCGLANPAFCETFEHPSPGGRGGDLDETRWSFSRWGHLSTQFFVRIPSTTATDVKFPASFCGAPFSELVPDKDVAICDGSGVDGKPSKQLNEVFDDHGGFGFNSMRIRQPFDFTGRTGTIVFDVDAKANPLNAGHGWWMEVWITADPEPMPYHGAPTVLAFPKNGVGFSFRGFSGCVGTETAWTNQLDGVFVTKNHAILHSYSGADFKWDGDAFQRRCFKTADGKLNRMKILINKDVAEVWASDYGDPGSLRQVAKIPNLGLAFTKGYVHLQHAAYNAHKDGGVTSVQTFRWDNVGFDGPVYGVPRAYDVDEPLTAAGAERGVLIGYPLPGDQIVTARVKGMDLTAAKRALFDFDVHTQAGRLLQYRFNGGPWHTFEIPQYYDNGEPLSQPFMRAFSIEAPLSELVNGDNAIDVRFGPAGPWEGIGNMDITLEGTQ